MHETNKDISDEEIEEYEIDFYIRILEALVEIYKYNSKENE
ncbi:hypothetical protein [Clostridium folliculivorans]|uniref:Uncharacterized protein n=1 Tax=Clostridium folliculivorans TaxID=2886038 RepID=A0A9W6DD95_9CLOT|nr:hypothetical protein [Clostridium folliculivorans]GKU27393.1 hypothetical protein CFOLD11_42200 [Clostridium folliculivorans]GKU32244.1 hypothetical protein CFB3_43520 [Clostridium folliculivorans]